YCERCSMWSLLVSSVQLAVQGRSAATAAACDDQEAARNARDTARQYRERPAPEVRALLAGLPHPRLPTVAGAERFGIVRARAPDGAIVRTHLQPRLEQRGPQGIPADEIDAQPAPGGRERGDAIEQRMHDGLLQIIEQALH